MTINSDNQADEILSVNHYDSSYAHQLQHDDTSDPITFSISATPRISSITPTTLDAPNTDVNITGVRFGSLDVNKLTLIVGDTKIKGGSITSAFGTDTWIVSVPCLPPGIYKCFFLFSFYFFGDLKIFIRATSLMIKIKEISIIVKCKYSIYLKRFDSHSKRHLRLNNFRRLKWHFIAKQS